MDWIYWSSTTLDMFDTLENYAWVTTYNGGLWTYHDGQLKTYAGGCVLAVRGGL
jgi:hypothetical protein